VVRGVEPVVFFPRKRFVRFPIQDWGPVPDPAHHRRPKPQRSPAGAEAVPAPPPRRTAECPVTSRPFGREKPAAWGPSPPGFPGSGDETRSHRKPEPPHSPARAKPLGPRRVPRLPAPPSCSPKSPPTDQGGQSCAKNWSRKKGPFKGPGTSPRSAARPGISGRKPAPLALLSSTLGCGAPKSCATKFLFGLDRSDMGKGGPPDENMHFCVCFVWASTPPYGAPRFLLGPATPPVPAAHGNLHTSDAAFPVPVTAGKKTRPLRMPTPAECPPTLPSEVPLCGPAWRVTSKPRCGGHVDVATKSPTRQRSMTLRPRPLTGAWPIRP